MTSKKSVDFIQAENDVADLWDVDALAGMDVTASLDEIAGKSVSKVVEEERLRKEAKEKADKLRKLRVTASESDGDATVDALLVNFPDLVRRESHWSSTLSAIMTRIGYIPVWELLRRPPQDATKSLSHAQIVKKHLSVGILQDITAKTVEWVKANQQYEPAEPAPVLVDEGIAVEIDDASASAADPDFGSW